MAQTLTFTSKQLLAKAAAEHAVATLNAAIATKGSAIWVLAGGSTPMQAYQYITEHLIGDLDWSKVTFLIGDERSGPLDGPDNNWHAIHQAFLHHIPKTSQHRPATDQPTNQAAGDYATQITALLQQPNTTFDLVWLGMGPDGHTLSLFPGHENDLTANSLVIPIYNSPKPPSERISLTLVALAHATTTVILAAGNDKADAVQQAQQSDCSLPIAQAARITNALWMIDAAAASAEHTLS